MAKPRPASGPVMLCILDGWGLRDAREGNAPLLAETPTVDRLRRSAPMATLEASGNAVGLPQGQMGNSEVGHMNLGAGRVVWMDLPRIDKAIEDGSFAANEELAAHIAALKASGGACHLIGLMSPGGVHAHQRHIAAAARAVAAAGVPVRIHALMDGRDTPPKAGAGYLEDFLASLDGAAGDIRVATVCGRFHAMDRDNRWERVEQAYGAIALGKGDAVDDAIACVRAAYDRDETDEFITPAVIGDYVGMSDGDGILMANFRADRARELLAALGDADFEGFERDRIDFVDMAGMVEYSTRHNTYMRALFPQQDIADTLGEVVARAGKRQFRLAETEKYPHVTFFFNGGVEEPNEGETRHMAPSPKVRTYDLQPEMSAPAVTDALVKAIGGGEYDLIIVNFANPDMVGHTGDLDAAIKACEAVDHGLGQALEALERAGGAALVTADHGNCEMMIDPDGGGPHTAHTTNPVPIFLVGAPGRGLRSGGVLGDIAPTLLALMGLEQPAAMTGRSLLEAV